MLFHVVCFTPGFKRGGWTSLWIKILSLFLPLWTWAQQNIFVGFLQLLETQSFTVCSQAFISPLSLSATACSLNWMNKEHLRSTHLLNFYSIHCTHVIELNKTCSKVFNRQLNTVTGFTTSPLSTWVDNIVVVKFIYHFPEAFVVHCDQWPDWMQRFDNLWQICRHTVQAQLILDEWH